MAGFEVRGEGWCFGLEIKSLGCVSRLGSILKAGVGLGLRVKDWSRGGHRLSGSRLGLRTYCTYYGVVAVATKNFKRYFANAKESGV
ncbi:hypothetical protein HAX54_041644, partial [Datura stramonium]|nr:hypothetical protein [Datura stramonium]